MKNINTETIKKTYAGKIYFCPWGDYSGSNFWAVYGHAIVCGYFHGYFDIPIAMITSGLGCIVRK